RRGKKGGVAGHELKHRRGHLFGEPLRQMRRFGEQDLAHAFEPACSLRDGTAPLARDEDIDVAADGARRGQRLGRRRRQRLVVVLRQQQHRHQSTPASFLSLSTSMATLSTLMPASRAFGSATAMSFSRGAMSTPSASGVVSLIGFFLAFMMLGSEA